MIPSQTAQQIADQIVAALEGEFNLDVPLMRGFTRKLAKILGMTFSPLVKFAGSIHLSRFPKTAPFKDIRVGNVVINPLKLHGELKNIFYKNGQRAERTISISVVETGGTLSSGSILYNPESRVTYQTVGDVTLSSATETALIRATRRTASGNVDTGTSLFFQNAPDSVEKEVTVVSGAEVTGTDEEGEEAYRERVMERYASWPQGGAMADYKHWGEQVEGVRNCYPYSGWIDLDIDGFNPDNGRDGDVFLYVESSVHQYGIPGTALLGEVAAHIENDEDGLSSRRHINDRVFCRAIIRRAFSVNISGLAGGDDPVLVQGAIENALSHYFTSRQPGGQAGYTVLYPRKDIIRRGEIDGIASRVAAAYGAVFDTVVISEEGIPSAGTIYLQEGEKARLFSMSWN